MASRLPLSLLLCLLSMPWIACSSQAPLPPPLTAEERAQAIRRGAAFERAGREFEIVLNKTPSGTSATGNYRLDRMTQGRQARIHPGQDVSIFVLAGRIRVRSRHFDRELAAGETMRIPNGIWYMADNLEEQGSSVLFAFDPASSSTLPEAATLPHAQLEADPRR